MPRAAPSWRRWLQACITTCSAARRALPRPGSASTRKLGGSSSMRPGERAVVIGGVGVLVLVALWGALSAPGRDLDDHRLSTYLTGPSGAKGLMQTLRRLGVTVEQRRRPYFDEIGRA